MHLVGFITKKLVTMHGHMNVTKVNKVVYAVVHLFRLRILAVGLPDRDAYCVIGNIKILSLYCMHHALMKGVIADTHIAAYRSKTSVFGKQDRNML